jgi:hypothetical protein
MFGVPVAESGRLGPGRKNISFMNQIAINVFTALHQKQHTLE